MTIFKKTGLSPQNAQYIDQLYEAFRQDPDCVTTEWRHYFFGLELAQTKGLTPSNFLPAAQSISTPEVVVTGAAERLITAYRMMRHLCAKTDALQGQQLKRPVELSPSYYGLQDKALKKTFSHVSIDPNRNIPLQEIINIIERVYCALSGEAVDDPGERQDDTYVY